MKREQTRVKLEPNAILLLQTEACADEVPVYGYEDSGQDSQDAEADAQGYVGKAHESGAKTVNQIENRVGKSEFLPQRRERLRRIEDSAEVDERCQDERRHYRDAVKALGVDAVDEAGERENE